MEINPDDCVAFEDVSIKEAMEIIEKNQHGFVVTDKSGKVMGVVTDGDVRRGLIKNLRLMIRYQAATTNFLWAITRRVSRKY